jgi:hypothetical protein
MTVRALPQRKLLPPHVALTIELFRGLSEFRQDYDGTILESLFAMLCEHMTGDEADKILSDTLALDNEIRFRLPCGLAVHDPGDDFASPDEEALVTLIARAEDHGDPTAALMAERLGIASYHALRECASSLARSLRQAGIETEWEHAPAAMGVAALTAAPHAGGGS